MQLARPRDLKSFIIMSVLSVTCSVLTVAAYHVFFSQRIVVMDISGFVASQKEDYRTGKISAGELVENINTLASRINTQRKNKVIILEDMGAGNVKGRSAVPDPVIEEDEDREKW